ncbi:unnamed protein product [Symbiodinium necroappetens]|uniref:Uncharacterized protein n=1 Tax=Symbiodinium necroappetens TaxID=1628268 RepID=A0A812Z0F9_9DINO|nr:unnamed protein product [Symbiodinium necroappetens]
MDLEIDLGGSKQTLKLATAQESCREDVEQGRLPTLQRQLVVPAAARVLGFKYHEAVEAATGFARVHDLCVLLEEEGKLYLEPLSRTYTNQLSQHLPGRVRWLPPALEAVEKTDKEGLDVTELPEVDGLQILRGSMDHIVDACYKDPWKALSFSKIMWWVDLSLLTCALFYIDIVLDVKQLALFYGSGLHGYLLLNMMSMALPIMFTTWDAIKFVGTPSADRGMQRYAWSAAPTGGRVCDIGTCTDKLSDLCPRGRFTDSSAGVIGGAAAKHAAVSSGVLFVPWPGFRQPR